MDHKIHVKSLSHSFGDRSILSGVELECNTGEIVSILGRNGTGKSTLFKILFGVLKANYAEIYLDSGPFDPQHHQGIFVGYHAQEVIMPKDIVVKSLISIYIKPEKQSNVFYTPGIHDMENKSIRKLSLGQQRYLQLLLLLNLDHQFIILDEPFSMVEPLYKELIKKTLIEFKSQKGILITDHYYLDVLEIADRNYLMKNGKIMPISKAEELIGLEYLSTQSLLF